MKTGPAGSGGPLVHDDMLQHMLLRLPSESVGRMGEFALVHTLMLMVYHCDALGSAARPRHP